MMERKFTDDDIVKALENCSDGSGEGIIQATIDLIKRQKAEIERLNHIRAELSKENDALKEEKDNLIKTYKECMTEDIKEFAERVKDIVDEPALIRGRVIDVTIAKIDNLVKEMTGENNGN